MENVDRQGIGTSTRNHLHRLVSIQSLAERPIQSPEDGKDGIGRPSCLAGPRQHVDHSRVTGRRSPRYPQLRLNGTEEGLRT